MGLAGGQDLDSALPDSIDLLESTSGSRASTGCDLVNTGGNVVSTRLDSTCSGNDSTACNSNGTDTDGNSATNGLLEPGAGLGSSSLGRLAGLNDDLGDLLLAILLLDDNLGGLSDVLNRDLLSGGGGGGLLRNNNILRDDDLLLLLDDDLSLLLLDDLLNVFNFLVGLVGLELISPLF
jgi:hypothetical protein